MATHPPGPAARTAATMVSGARNINSVPAARVVIDIADDIILWEPEATPLVTLTAGLRKKRKALQQQYQWIEKDPYPREVVVSGAVTAIATALNVAAGNGARVATNYVLLNRRTRENILVRTVATDALSVVVRALGGVVDAMVDGDILEFVGIAAEDGAGIGTLKSIQEVINYNYTQIFRTPFGFTGREANTEMYGGRDPVTEQKWQGIEHRKSIERAFFFGKRHSLTGPLGNPQTMTGGAEYYINSNVWDLGGNEPNERAFTEYLEYAMKYGDGGHAFGSGHKMLYASRRWVTVIEGWGKDRLRQTELGNSKVGMKVTQFVTTHGIIDIMPVNIFDGEHAGYAFLIDPNHVRYAYHQGRDTKLLKDRQGNDIDGEQHEYFSDCGFQMELEGAHGLLKGLPV